MKKIEPMLIKLTNEYELYEATKTTVVEIESKDGKRAVLSLPAGTWKINERKKKLTLWQSFLKFFKLYSDKTFIRATRVR